VVLIGNRVMVYLHVGPSCSCAFEQFWRCERLGRDLGMLARTSNQSREEFVYRIQIPPDGCSDSLLECFWLHIHNSGHSRSLHQRPRWRRRAPGSCIREAGAKISILVCVLVFHDDLALVALAYAWGHGPNPSTHSYRQHPRDHLAAKPPR
jgi:hypothetical protein